MNKISCEIIKDLLPNYVEDLVSNETKEAVEKHIEDCKSCKEIWKLLKDEKDEKEKKEEEIEINHLKKYNRRLFIFKIIAGVLSVVILVIWGTFLVTNLRYKDEFKHGKYVYGLIQEASNKLEELENEDNLEIIEENISLGREGIEDKDTQLYIRKYINDKSSEKLTWTNQKREYKGITNSYSITLGDITKELLIDEKGGTTAIYREPYKRTPYIPLSGYDEFECSKFEVREEEYNGKICYVIRRRNRSILSRNLDR